MIVEQQKKQNAIVIRIRELQNEIDHQGSLGLEKTTELENLQNEARTKNWIYW